MDRYKTLVFGYRYDTETGLYYLQSRYYNPEWCRFINADAIVGQVGELLCHNLFAYAKNNPINMRDSAGYRFSFNSEEEENAYQEWIYEQRLEATSKTSFLGITPERGKSLSKGLVGSFADELIAMHTIDNISDYMKVSVKISDIRKFKHLVVPAPTETRLLKGTLKAFGVIGIFFTAKGIVDNYSGYGFGEATARSLIDLAVVAAAASTGIVGGVVASYGGELLKDYLFNK